MILVNLSHPLTREQLADIEAMANQKIARHLEQMPQFDVSQPFAKQVIKLVDSLDLRPVEWQQQPLLVLLPSLNFGAAAVLAEIHGRCGYFPPIIRIRPVSGILPPEYEVAELINLQEMRDEARKTRGKG